MKQYLQHFVIGIIALMPFIAYTQPGTFVHKFSLYFENAAGAKDTLEIRVDTLRSEVFDPVYMQVYHPEYFIADTVVGIDPNKSFEVYTLPHRDLLSAGFVLPHFSNGLNHGTFNFYRSVTLNYSLPAFGEWGLTSPVILLFRCKRSDMPITISWDKSYFTDIPVTNPFSLMQIVPEYLLYAAPDASPGVDYWMDPEHVQCLRSDGSWTIHLGDPDDYTYYDYRIFGFIEPSQDTLWGVLMNDIYYGGYCFPSSTHEANVSEALGISPNPATTSITIQTAQSAARSQVMVYNNWGQLMPVHTKIQDDVSVQLDLSGYPPGMYWVELREEGIRRGVGRFVKQE
jgi:Secretion system C-terminal sorting domain